MSISAEKIIADFREQPMGVSKILCEILQKSGYPELVCTPQTIKRIEDEVNRLLAGGSPHISFSNTLSLWLKKGID